MSVNNNGKGSDTEDSDRESRGTGRHTITDEARIGSRDQSKRDLHPSPKREISVVV